MSREFHLTYIHIKNIHLLISFKLSYMPYKYFNFKVFKTCIIFELIKIKYSNNFNLMKSLKYILHIFCYYLKNFKKTFIFNKYFLKYFTLPMARNISKR